MPISMENTATEIYIFIHGLESFEKISIIPPETRTLNGSRVTCRDPKSKEEKREKAKQLFYLVVISGLLEKRTLFFGNGFPFC